MLTIAVCSLVLPGAYAQTYYENTSIILSILSQPEAWKGASYDNDGGANYLFRPIKDMSGVAWRPHPVCSLLKCQTVLEPVFDCTCLCTGVAVFVWLRITNTDVLLLIGLSV
jgi:hypothetical protein